MIWVKINGIWVQSTPFVKSANQWINSTVYSKKDFNWVGAKNVGLELFLNPDPISNSLKSSKFAVSVYDGQSYLDAHVYSSIKQAWVSTDATRNLWVSGSYPIINYLTFSINNSTTAKVSKIGTSVTSIDVGPYNKNKNSNIQISNGEAYIPINKNDKLWVTINNEVSSPLFIFADEPFPTYAQATATFPTYNHVLIPTGINFVSSLTATLPVTINSAEGYSNRLQVSSDTLIYVPRGAYLKGNFNISGCNNVKFMGQGIVSLENYDWWNDFKEKSDSIKSHGTVFYSTNASTPNSYLDWRLSGNGCSGLTVINTPFYFNGEGALQSVENIKFISPWNYNTDGPRIGNFYYPTEGAKLLNSFIFNADDCSLPAVTQAFGNALVSGCYFNSHHGGIFTNYFVNFNYTDYFYSAIDIDVRAYVPSENGIGAVFRLYCDTSLTALPNSNYRGPTNLIFSGIRIENDIGVPMFRIGNIGYPYEGGAGNRLGMLSSITFTDITVSSTNSLVSSNIISGLNSTNEVKDVTFNNVKINNVFLTDLNYDNYFDLVGSTDKVADNIDFNTT